jgi:rsbT antagonist protein RsbS
MNEDTHTIPVIHLWDNLLVSLQGDISDAQAEHLRNELLKRICAIEADGLVIDVSGVSVIDSHLCSVLAGITEAAGLMGVHSMLCGLSPEVVMTLQAMGIELDGIETHPSLEDALGALGIGPLGAAGAGRDPHAERSDGGLAVPGASTATPDEGEEIWETLRE